MSQKKAIPYSRVSTAQQADEGVSLDAQLARARAWCQAQGYEVVAEYQDAGLSGGRMDNRPGLQAAIDHACREKAALLVYSLSRLGRSTKDVLAIAERLDKEGADLVSLSENIDTTSATGKMVFRILAVLAEFERDLASERTTEIMAHRRENGYKTGGDIPYGYDTKNVINERGKKTKKLIQNAQEQQAIRLMSDLRERGLTLRAIGDELEARGILTKTGKKWSPKTIKRILDRVDRDREAA